MGGYLVRVPPKYELKRGVRMTQETLDRCRGVVRWVQESRDPSYSLDRFIRDALEAHLKKYATLTGRTWSKSLPIGRRKGS